MSEELKAQLLSMLQSLTEAAKSGASWTATQIPELVKEKIILGRVEETLTLLSIIFGMVMLFRCGKFILTKLQEPRERFDEPIGWIYAMIGTISAFVAFTIAFFASIHHTMLVWFAPRLYIVEWLLSLT